MRLPLLCQLPLWTAASARTSGCVQEPCGGHGHLGDDGKCVCDAPWPSAGQQGWTGPACGIRTWGTDLAALAAGTDLTAWCRSQGCAALEPAAWSCWAVPAMQK